MGLGIAIALVVLVVVLRVFFKVTKWVVRLAVLTAGAVAIAIHYMRAP